MKNIFASVIIASSLFAANSFAATITSGTAIQPGNQGCELLAQAVTINLSSNVYGAYNCVKENNVIKVATCHKAGSRKKETVKCAAVDKDEDDNTVWNDASCEGKTGEDAVFETDNKGKGYFATTAGGSVGAMSLSAFCDSATPVDTLVK
ncbi:hypothetical protein N7320_21115 [Stutzerimonas stutzeri]|uniref:hypothetical protein n=1 Tax=Stutzerimonas stutzeri TaxID=316 RepID=UPI00244AE575|nr:hypothetical protein [Stutzerimonas stutzeri]MDH0103822.1 hypothetical protein [Stutzerimonas stutzeri]